MFLEKLFLCGWYLLFVKVVYSFYVKIIFFRWVELFILFLMCFVFFIEIVKRYGDVYGG